MSRARSSASTLKTPRPRALGMRHSRLWTRWSTRRSSTSRRCWTWARPLSRGGSWQPAAGLHSGDRDRRRHRAPSECRPNLDLGGGPDDDPAARADLFRRGRRTPRRPGLDRSGGSYPDGALIIYSEAAHSSSTSRRSAPAASPCNVFRESWGQVMSPQWPPMAKTLY